MNTQTITIPAQGAISLSIQGRVFACISTTGDYAVRFDAGSKVSCTGGRVYGSPTGKKYSRITFYNDSANAIDTTFYAGFEAYSANFPVVSSTVVTTGKDASTYTKSHNSTSLAAGGTWTFNGVDNGKQRRQIVVANNDSSAVLQILDNANNIGGYVQPLTSWTIATNGVVKVKNPTANPVNAAVLETFYS